MSQASLAQGFSFMHDVKTIDFSRIAQDLQIRKVQVESVTGLLDDGNTVPFITRYRKEKTGGLNEEVIRTIQMRVQLARQLAERKETILKSIEAQGKLTEELRAAIKAAETSKRLEDLYLPYKPKKRTLATAARERGLEPFALAIWNQDPAVANLSEVLPTLVNPEKELHKPEDVILGAQHLLAEQISDTAEVRAAVRSVLWETGRLTAAKSESLAEGQGLDYKDYFQFAESARQIPPHRILAINRGEKEGVLKVQLQSNAEAIRKALFDRLPLANHTHGEFLKKVGEDALIRLILPSLEREIRRELTEEAEGHAVQVFARNLRSLLLQPPLHGQRVLAIDPGFRTGCKLAALDEIGNLLEDAVIFPHPPQNKKADARVKLEELVRKHQITVIAIGNGTACRETEEVISELIGNLEKRRRREPESASPGSTQSQVNGTATTSNPPLVATAVSSHSHTVQQIIAAGVASVPVSQPSLVEAVPSLPELSGDVTSIVSASSSEKQNLTNLPATGSMESALVVPTWPVPTETPVVPALSEASAAAIPALSADLPPASPDLAYVIVNEAGASVYSASAIGREEFPSLDATLRGTISIGRRLQDPLSELVKIDPQNIGVGLYQHDINPKYLKESLDAVIESSVNHVGIDVNTASVPLLRNVSGLNQLVARELVDFRKQHGPFKNRAQLLQVPNLGPARFLQAAGFLKITGGENPLDCTWIHPESYPVAQRLLSDLGYSPAVLEDKPKTEELREKLKSLSPQEICPRLEVGLPTLRDILDALARPGRDPREDLPPPVFKKGILKIEDLIPGMELKGTVLNVVDFGAFVDIGLKDSGLVHISQMANRFIKNPYDVVAVGDVVKVWVMAVDQERRRVSLTMIRPGTERKPLEKSSPQPGTQMGGKRPPRGRRPAPRHGQGAKPGQPPARTALTPETSAGVSPPSVPASGENMVATPPAARESTSPPAPRPVPPHRKPQRHPPKAKLTKAALEGDTPLRTFGELKAFFEAKGKDAVPGRPDSSREKNAENKEQGTGNP